MTSCLKILTSRLTLVRRFALVTTILAILFCIADLSNERQVVEARQRRKVRLEELLGRFPRQENANFSEYELNVTVSNALPVDRAIPDVRSPGCRQIVYDLDSLPDVSVIIPFHNEAWSILLRAVHSILNRTPGQLLREIILVDDLSTRSYLKQTLTEYVENLSGKIRILRNSAREGLIRSRVRAAKVASGEVLVFLDAHVEVNVDWLQPLLVTILSQDRKTLAVPLIDNIDDQTIEYSNWDYMVHGGLTGSMDYVWKFLPRRLSASRKAETDPIRTPTTIGCAMAIDRKFFFDLGEFDNGMFIWGGENLEISIRMWPAVGQSTSRRVPGSVTCSGGGFRTSFRPDSAGRISGFWTTSDWSTYGWMISRFIITRPLRSDVEPRRPEIWPSDGACAIDLDVIASGGI